MTEPIKLKLIFELREVGEPEVRKDVVEKKQMILEFSESDAVKARRILELDKIIADNQPIERGTGVVFGGRKGTPPKFRDDASGKAWLEAFDELQTIKRSINEPLLAAGDMIGRICFPLLVAYLAAQKEGA